MQRPVLYLVLMRALILPGRSQTTIGATIPMTPLPVRRAEQPMTKVITDKALEAALPDRHKDRIAYPLPAKFNLAATSPYGRRTRGARGTPGRSHPSADHTPWCHARDAHRKGGGVRPGGFRFALPGFQRGAGPRRRNALGSPGIRIHPRYRPGVSRHGAPQLRRSHHQGYAASPARSYPIRGKPPKRIGP